MAPPAPRAAHSTPPPAALSPPVLIPERRDVLFDRVINAGDDGCGVELLPCPGWQRLAVPVSSKPRIGSNDAVSNCKE